MGQFEPQLTKQADQLMTSSVGVIGGGTTLVSLALLLHPEIVAAAVTAALIFKKLLRSILFTSFKSRQHVAEGQHQQMRVVVMIKLTQGH